MLAELHGKISSNGTNLSERREDQLTGDIFGTLRYIPYSKGLLPLLENAILSNKEFCDQYLELIRNADLSGFPNRVIAFWPSRREAEIDVLVDFPQIIIGIEVKYGSGLSSDDDKDNSAKEKREAEEIDLIRKSPHQLAREARMLTEESEGKPAILLFLAPESCASSILNETINLNILSKSVEYGYLTWQQVTILLEQLLMRLDLTAGEKAAISDMFKLLERKGFNVFSDFSNCNEPKIDCLQYFEFDFNANQFFLEGTLIIRRDDYYEYC